MPDDRPSAADALYPNGPRVALGNEEADSNLDNATSEMRLTKQEQNLYQHHLDNRDKGGVKNPDGSTSTLLATTVGFDDKTYVIPTIWDNKKLSADEAKKRALAKGIDHFPSYDNREEATSRYMKMHDYMEGDLR